jgi:hypothetical protein
MAVAGAVGVDSSPPAQAAGSALEAPKVATDCSTDTTAKLTHWIASAPPDSTLTMDANACYRVDGTLSIVNAKHLTLDGNGATIKAFTPGDRTRSHVLVAGGSDITIRDLTVHGANPHAGPTAAAYVPAKEAQHGFALAGVDGVVLEHVEVHDVYGDFVYVGPGGTGTWSRNVRVADSTFDGSGRQGISVTGGKDVTIDHNVIRNVARSLFDLEPNTADDGAQKIVITRNTTGAAKNFWIASKGVGAKIDFTVEHNTMKEKTGNVIWVYGPPNGYRGPLVVNDNTFIAGGKVNDEKSTGAFFYAKVDGVTMHGNKVTFPKSGDVPFVETRDSKNLDISGNSLIHAGKEQIDTSPAWPRPDQPKTPATTGPRATTTTRKGATTTTTRPRPTATKVSAMFR